MWYIISRVRHVFLHLCYRPSVDLNNWKITFRDLKDIVVAHLTLFWFYYQYCFELYCSRCTAKFTEPTIIVFLNIFIQLYKNIQILDLFSQTILSIPITHDEHCKGIKATNWVPIERILFKHNFKKHKTKKN